MPTKKRPDDPTLQLILDEVRSNGAQLRSLDEEVRSHGEQLRSHGEQLRSLDEQVGSQGEQLRTLDERVRTQGVEIRGHSVLLEDMRSQNRITIEAVEATRRALTERIDRLDEDTRARDAVLELAIRELRATVQENTTDIRALAHIPERLTHLEERVAAIERREA
jgi:chromosome segregation ATPase